MKLKLIIVTMVLFIPIAIFSQSISFNFNTGDADLDVTLNNINVIAKDDESGFESDLSVSFGVAIPKIHSMIIVEKMQPAEVYFLLEIAKQEKKPVDVVLKARRTHKAKGWGFIVREMGIRPGSKEFKNLKNSSKTRHDKWKNNKNRHYGKNNK